MLLTWHVHKSDGVEGLAQGAILRDGEVHVLLLSAGPVVPQPRRLQYFEHYHQLGLVVSQAELTSVQAFIPIQQHAL